MSYKIPENTKLIILDAHDTLLKRDLSRDPKNPLVNAEDKEKVKWFLRDGFLNFLDYFGHIKGIKLAISSDGGKQYLKEVCRKFGIERQFTAIYGREHLDRESLLKRVDKILTDLKIEPSQAVFIGDSPIDERSAGDAGVHFINVPDSVKDPIFSFNCFIPVEFNQNQFGLEIQKITNPKGVYHNLSTPQLVEEIIRHQEGKLQHLGKLEGLAEPNRLRNPENSQIGYYLVGEPYEDPNPYLGSMPLLDVEDFQTIHQRMLVFLQDREIFLQDCFLGASGNSRIPLRVITQKAWPSLWIRHMLIQAHPVEMEGFFPEFTVIFLPNFQAVPEFDNIESERFVIINLLKKVVLIGGVSQTGEIKECLFRIMNHHLPKSDNLPLRAGALLNEAEESLLILGPSDEARYDLALQLKQSILGLDLFAWAPDGISNMEWGLSLQLSGQIELQDRLKGLNTHFAALIEPGEGEKLSISFPMTHLPRVVRMGVAASPKRLLLLIADQCGLIPEPALISAEQACLLFLLGPLLDTQGKLTSRPLYSLPPYMEDPLHIALGLWEKLKRSKTDTLLLQAEETQIEALQAFARGEAHGFSPLNETAQVEQWSQILQSAQPWAKELPREFLKGLPESWAKAIAELK